MMIVRTRRLRLRRSVLMNADGLIIAESIDRAWHMLLRASLRPCGALKTEPSNSSVNTQRFHCIRSTWCHSHHLETSLEQRLSRLVQHITDLTDCVTPLQYLLNSLSSS